MEKILNRRLVTTGLALYERKSLGVLEKILNRRLVTAGLALYERKSNGSYVVSGFNVQFLEVDNGEQGLVITEGKVHINGYEIELPHDLRVRFPEDPDIDEQEMKQNAAIVDGELTLPIGADIC